MTSTSTATQRARPHAGPAWLVLALACACQFMVILDAAIVNVALRVATVVSQLRGLSGIPSAGHCATAAMSASCTASSHSSKLP
jgi:hypothetical protein